MKKCFTKKVILNSIQDLLIKIDRFRIKHGMTKGFTLAEVLITLGVIGVVAAITMPILIQNYNKKVWATSLKKAYSTASQACNMMLAKEGVNDISDTEFFQTLTEHNGFETVAHKYFNNAQIRKLSTVPADYYAIDNGIKNKDGEPDWNSKYAIELPDFTYYIHTYSQVPVHGEGSYLQNIIFDVDINGANKRPNIVGKDFYRFVLNYSCKQENAGTATGLCGNYHMQGQLDACFQKVMEDGWEIKYDIK